MNIYILSLNEDLNVAYLKNHLKKLQAAGLPNHKGWAPLPRVNPPVNRSTPPGFGRDTYGFSKSKMIRLPVCFTISMWNNIKVVKWTSFFHLS